MPTIALSLPYRSLCRRCRLSRLPVDRLAMSVVGCRLAGAVLDFGSLIERLSARLPMPQLASLVAGLPAHFRSFHSLLSSPSMLSARPI